jgi:16S rRNA (guanine527-N7)-methyltransferase
VSRALEALASGARFVLGRPLSSHQAESFEKYLSLLAKWQRSQRLVGSVEPGWVVDNLFLDSLVFLRVLPEPLGTLGDLGSGAGFPGIPIKIVKPETSVTLIESRERRASFLSAVIRELGLEDVRVLNARAEVAPALVTERFDAVTIRCAGKPDDLLPAASRLVVAGGLVVVSGPPTVSAPSEGPWVEVPGATPGSTRRFLVHRVQGSGSR